MVLLVPVEVGVGEGFLVVGVGEGFLVVGVGEGFLVVGVGEGFLVVGVGEGFLVVGVGEGFLVVAAPDFCIITPGIRTPKSKTKSLREICDMTQIVFATGQLLGAYPEGTLTRDPAGWPMVAKHGLAHLAIMTHSPEIPIALSRKNGTLGN